MAKAQSFNLDADVLITVRINLTKLMTMNECYAPYRHAKTALAERNPGYFTNRINHIDQYKLFKLLRGFRSDVRGSIVTSVYNV